MTIFVATHNAHKLREIAQILPGFEIVADDPEGVVEDAPDFIGNALIKVRAIAEKHKGAWCLADDSGLEVKALGGAPGVRSARYAGEPTNTPANNALLLKNLEGVVDRTANFTCAIALVDPDGREHTVVGKSFGKIALAPSGAEGFGYDPLFVPDGHDKSFAELSAEEKNAISHRGRALEEVKKIVGEGTIHLRGNAATADKGIAWLRLFRVVNLPTVPGDVFVGAAAVACSMSSFERGSVWWTAVSSVLLYMFGLVQNDICGAKTDKGRPISDGLISLDAAKSSCAICWVFAWVAVWFPVRAFPGCFWMFVAFFVMTVLISVYNATKRPLLMGLCRAANVVYGGVAVAVSSNSSFGEMSFLLLGALAAVWLAYIWVVTLYSRGEENDPEKKRRVGAFVGGLVYLQLTALILLTLRDARLMPLLVAGAVLLVVLRLFKRALPGVSAS